MIAPLGELDSGENFINFVSPQETRAECGDINCAAGELNMENTRAFEWKRRYQIKNFYSYQPIFLDPARSP